ncbi:hypothetical protein KC354_g6836 [Hortaea werneckii]|nr:hypothetical protein KC354_g6836 [Hortaea werneckii]
MNIMNGQSTIPLTCNICTRRPDFSDVSHLLTHIASKGHLSSYYKIKVKASADPACRRQIEEYDDWYAEWNLDELMRDRMSQKERRSARGTGNGTTMAAPRRGSAAASNSSRSTPAAAMGGRNSRQQPRQLRDSLLNPRLGRSFMADPYSRPGTPGSGISHTSGLNSFYAPPMPSWPSTPYGDMPIKRESIGSSLSDESFGIDADSAFHPPPTRGYASRLSDEDDSLPNEDEWEMDETTSDAAKLKGVFWPGMAMFDSATPEMKRKRNQKKDYSVMEQLKATSEYVEPNELIFDVTGAFRKQRVITGNPELEDDESLLSGEASPEPEPPKKRQARRARPALLEKNVNTGRVLRQRRSAHAPGGLVRSARPYCDGPVSEEDDSLTFGPPGRRQHAPQRRGMSIHRDNTGPEITFDTGLPAPPAGYAPAGMRNPFQSVSNFMQPSQSSFAGNPARNHQRLPSLNFNDPGFGTSFRPSSAGTNLPAPNYASFGGLNTHTLFQNSLWPAPSGSSALGAFAQQFGLGGSQSNAFANNSNVFAPSYQNHGNNSGDWGDIFSTFSQPQNNLSGISPDNVQPAGVELNPLFFSSAGALPRDDDEATVSPPPSEH